MTTRRECPYCGVEVDDAWNEIAHMEARHPEVIAERLRAAGLDVPEPPEGHASPWLIIARAGGPHGQSENVEARLHQVPGEPDELVLAETLEAIIDTYRKSFGKLPARFAVAALPWFQGSDDPDE